MPEFPDLIRPEKVLGLLWIPPRLAAAALRLTGSTLRIAAALIDRAPAPSQADPAADELWSPPERDSAVNGSGDLDAAARAPEREAPVPPTPERDAPAREDPVPSQGRAPSEPPVTPDATTDPAESPLERSDHVSEEATLVAEVADAGAEDGAGPEIHVEEPWTGYGEMTAPDIVDRLAAEPLEVAAVVKLYERTHRRRRTVLDAAEREVRRRSGPGARD